MEILLIPILTALAVIVLALTVDTSTVIFGPIGVPPEWENRGYTSAVVTARLTGDIRRMNNEADSFKRGRGVRLGSEKTVTQALGGYLDIEAPIWILQKKMGLIEFTVSGEIVLKDKDKGTYQFQLRSASESTSVLTSTECGSIDRPDELIRLAAEEVLRAVDPYILAAYYFGREEDAYYVARELARGNELGELTDYEELGEQKNLDDTCAVEPAKRVGPFHQTVVAIKDSLARLSVTDRKWSYDLWGLVHMVKNEYQLAIDKFERALATDPKFAIAIRNWGIALAAQGRYREAIDKYREAEAAGGENLPGIYNAWAMALDKLGHPNEALSTFELVKTMDPNYADVYNKMGDLYESLGQIEKAHASFERALQLDPTGEGFKQDVTRLDKMLVR